MATEYILVERSSRLGKNGTTFWRLTFYCMADGLLYEMTVDNTYDNFKKYGWDHVVQDDTPWGIYTGLKRTQRKTSTGFPVVSADGMAKIEQRCRDRDEALTVVAMDQQRRQGKNNAWGALFE